MLTAITFFVLLSPFLLIYQKFSLLNPSPTSSVVNVSFFVGGGAIIVAIIVVSLLLSKRRKTRLEDELIEESWEAFRSPIKGEGVKGAELEGGAVDGAQEVVNDIWSKLEQEEGLR